MKQPKSPDKEAKRETPDAHEAPTTILQALPAVFFVHVHVLDLPSYFRVTNPVTREEAKSPNRRLLVYMERR